MTVCCKCGWDGKGRTMRICRDRLECALRDVLHATSGWQHLRSRYVTGSVLAVQTVPALPPPSIATTRPLPLSKEDSER